MRWSKDREEEWAPGFWKFVYRDNSYSPGDHCELYLDKSTSTGKVGLKYYYDGFNYPMAPPEFVLDAIEILQRYWSHHTHALAQLAQQAE